MVRFKIHIMVKNRHTVFKNKYVAIEDNKIVIKAIIW